MKPRLLDLFCGAGGAAMGYSRAGFEVVGVDLVDQPRYPFTFIQADAMTFPLDGFDAIHASPPCQAYSPHVSSASSKWVPSRGKDEPRLIAVMRDRLVGRSYVIENVMGAAPDLMDPLQLCGTMFGLPISRHRLFESSQWLWPSPDHPDCRGVAKREATRLGWDYRDMTVTGKGRRAGTSDRWRYLLGIDWPTTQHELTQAIPPAYTEWIGRQLIAAIQVAA